MAGGTACRGKLPWSALLTGMGLGWLVATSLTALGMYMVACHGTFTHYVRTGDQRSPAEQGHAVPVKGGVVVLSNGCSGGWTAGEGQMVLVAGSMLNIMLLILMLFFLIYDRRSLQTPPRPAQDPPPDYETVVKEETPPPAYSDLNIPPEDAPMLIHTSTPSPTPTEPPTPSPTRAYYVKPMAALKSLLFLARNGSERSVPSAVWV